MTNAHIARVFAGFETNQVTHWGRKADPGKFYYAPLSYEGDVLWSEGFDSGEEAAAAAIEAGFEVEDAENIGERCGARIDAARIRAGWRGHVVYEVCTFDAELAGKPEARNTLEAFGDWQSAMVFAKNAARRTPLQVSICTMRDGSMVEEDIISGV